MDKTTKLLLLKQDVGILSNAKDDYLEHLLSQSKQMMEREGIVEEDTDEFHGLNIQYAAYLFRKRAGTDTAMPKYLRWGLNNMLFSQKGRTEQ